ncbi:hypothetical protein TNCV_839451 [Trichonephila clavipes]|nr:hypothetical protein TNCV_839451 [Trichonephila clavipes]
MMMVHDGVPVYLCASVCDWLEIPYPGSWIGHVTLALRPLRLSVLIPLDFFLWSPLKIRFLFDLYTTRLPDEIGQAIQEVVDLAMQINLEVDSNDVQEMLDSHNQELTADGLIEVHEPDKDIAKDLRL